jgi:hypothetical protein
VFFQLEKKCLLLKGEGYPSYPNRKGRERGKKEKKKAIERKSDFFLSEKYWYKSKLKS